MSELSALNSALIPWKQAISAAPQIMLGLSGGMDSILLLKLLSEQVDTKLIQAVHVNHGLSDSADQWQQFVEGYCRQLGVDFYAEKVQLVVSGEGVEAAARDARYAVFERRLKKDGLLFLAHHADDQVETVVYRLLRGSGSKGLAGMPESRPLGLGQLIRPLLAYSKEAIHREANNRDLKWIEDESNLDDRFDRNYIRNQVIPVIAKRWPAYPQAVMHSAGLNDQANQLSQDLALEDLARLDVLDERAGWSISMDGLSNLSVLRQKNVLRYWSEIKNLPAPSSKIINEILSSVVAARQDASPEVIWRRQCWARFQSRLYLLRCQNKNIQQDQSMYWDMQHPLVLADKNRLDAQRAKGNGLVASAESIEIRYRQGGERCKPQGRDRSSSLKKLLLEYQLPPWLRDRVPLFYVQDQLVAVGDLWVCEGWGAKPEESGMEIHWQVDSV
ncbi:tRNA lysidine(34) synthetase TilS [Porticoccaceae bacterium]|jgi:tRNA(Ile)-lysidine synthase|nr:tRNA lysidine(34) synthetase TilS [Porticoccaceae bacterium]MDA9569838.1 tRNA lysidine(34) synthetase TilS [Porticoccaceae bacterium]